MGKKRKKSKGRKKQQRRAEPKADPASEGRDPDVSPAEGDDGEAGTPVESPDDVAAVIDLDDELDDPEARAALVAAAAALESDDGSAGDDPDPSSDGPASTPEMDRSEAGASGDAGGEKGPTGARSDEPADQEQANDPDRDGPEGAEDARDTDGAADGMEGDQPLVSGDPDAVDEAGDSDAGALADEAAPLIGPDALVALSEFRQEGVATIPGELVLDLGDASSPEERDRLLAAALAHVEMQDAIYRVPLESGTSRRWKGLLATALFLAAILLAGLPPAFLVPEGIRPLTPAEEMRGIRLALLMQAEQIAAFEARADRLPTTLAEVETALPGIRFVRSSNRLYQLVAYTDDGDAVVYDSSAPDPSFADAAGVWRTLRGES